MGVRLRMGVGLSDASAPAFRRLRDVEALARRLAAFARAHEANVPLKPSVSWIHAQGFRELVMLSLEPHHEAMAIVAPVVLGPGVAAVHEAVRRKEAKLVRYRALVDEAWLLLVTGASWTQATDSVLTEGLQVESGFDAVCLLDLREEVVQKLR